MSTWVAAVVTPCVLALVNLVALFYFKWVPNVEDQKRHVKHVGAWVLDGLNLSSGAGALYFLMKSKHPVTPVFVVGVALVAGLEVLSLVLFAFRRWILGGLFRAYLDGLGLVAEMTDRHTDAFDRLQRSADRHIAITERLFEAFCVLADDPNLSPETTKALRTLMDGNRAASQIPETASVDSVRGGLDRSRLDPSDASE